MAPAIRPTARVAVVGAGMAGAACARTLADRGLAVAVLDKGRSVGGRLAQRRVCDALAFDHGAQYVTARDPAFVAAADGWLAEGALAAWPGVGASDGVPALVGVPAMNAPVRHLLTGVEVATAIRVAAARRAARGWSLALEGGGEAGPFDILVLAVPAPQAVHLLAAEPAAGRVVDALSGVVVEPCWAAMLAFGGPVRPEWTGRRVDDDALAWVARNASRPGRGGAGTWTAHARPGWSQRHLEREPGEVAPLLAAALARVLGGPLPEPTHLSAHRWRHALVRRPLGEPCLLDPALGLGLCGDWCLGPRVEAAFLSGTALAQRIGGN